MRYSMLIVVLLALLVQEARAQWTPRNLNASAGIRLLTRTPNGKPGGRLLGGRSSRHAIEIWASDDEGATWRRTGTVASNPKIAYGDVCLLNLGTSRTVYCAFREQEGATFRVTVCRSEDGGANWTFDSVVATATGKFVGAPFLFDAPNGDLQIYYDSEPIAGNGFQWIYVQARSRNAPAGTLWTKYQGVASRPMDATKLARDGMPSVVRLNGKTLLLVCEGVDPDAPATNCLYAVPSFDSGCTWDFAQRRKIWSPVKNGVAFNAYCPMAVRFGKGEVGVIFCTDDDFDAPSANHIPPPQRRAHVKFLRMQKMFERWGDLETVDASADSMYAPGAFPLRPNVLLSTVDLYRGVQSLRVRTFR